jgi:hypothetical protein
VKFNVDGFSMTPGARFMTGRIVGTIGPAGPDEPGHFVVGRQFMAVAGPGPAAFFAPAGGVNFCVAAVDHATRRVYLDLGNALPTTTPGGPPSGLGDLALWPAADELALYPAADGQAGAPAGAPQAIGVLASAAYTDPAWYPATAGIAVFPPDRPLTDGELAAVGAGPLSLVATVPGGKPAAVISEPSSGLFVRADQFVFRLNPGQGAAADLYATRFGRPYAGAGVITVPVPGQLQPDSPLAPGQAPPVAVPAGAVSYPARAVTDARGRARLRMRARDPGRPRDYIDGQVYALCPVLEETVAVPGDPYPYNQWNFVSLRVWSGFTPGEPPTWHGDIEPVLRQYANLYPVMRDFLDLGDYESVCANAKRLAFSFGLGIGDPDSMPVTRDLSAAKRGAVLRWLSEPGEDGKPPLGEPLPPAGPVPARPVTASAVTASAVTARTGPATTGPATTGPATTGPAGSGPRPGAAPPPSGGQAPPHHGGKASAASRRPAARRGAHPAWEPR